MSIFNSHKGLIKNSNSIAKRLALKPKSFSLVLNRVGTVRMEDLVLNAIEDLGMSVLAEMCDEIMMKAWQTFIVSQTCTLLGIRNTSEFNTAFSTSILVSTCSGGEAPKEDSATPTRKLTFGKDTMKITRPPTRMLTSGEDTMKITRPVMVGSVNILEASDDMLVSIIRQAQDQIKIDSDIAKLSQKFMRKEGVLRGIIALCLLQLDKEAEEL
tara:strand:- start:18 stop:656 length:639 start_codon:yes stop_codon:yes gene_type:complete